MKRKGFTLIELLAVIVILSVITLITVPMITSIIEESKKKALASSVQGLIESANLYAIENEGVYEFLFDEEHQGSTKKGEHLDYRGTIEGEGKLYIDKEGNTSICISNDTYYAYKNYNSEIVVGERKEGNCIIGFDALTNKYIAMLDDGTGQVSNVYSKDEVNNLVDSLDTKITNNTSEISNIKNNIEELQTNLNNYAYQSELEKTNSNLNDLSSIISSNKTELSTSIENLKSDFMDKLSSKMNGLQYVGNGTDSGQNERRPSFDFSSLSTGLYLVLNSNWNVSNGTYGAVTIVCKNEVGLFYLQDNNNTFGSSGQILYGQSYSWNAVLNVYKIL